MKKISAAVLVVAAVLAFLGSCNFILGPDKPAAAGNEEGGTGNLVISVGGGEREIAPGGTLPGDVLAVLRYELTLTGPGGSTLTAAVSPGQNLSMTVMVGGWRIDARAYQENALAGTGSLNFTVSAGVNSVRVPMNMSGSCYEIKLSGDTVHGTVRSNFTVAFPGTAITITAEKDGDAFFIDGTLSVLTVLSPVTLSGSGTIGSFAMPAEDVELYADFRQFVRYVDEDGIGYGESWEDASGDLQKMMDELEALSLNSTTGYTGPYIVKLGAGTYKPQYKSDNYYTTDYATPANDRDSAFLLREGVQVWGGYAAGGEDLDEATRKGRFNEDGTVKLPAHKAVLSGDFNNDDSVTGSGSTLAISGNDENARHVVLAVDIPANSGTVLDGLTIEGGSAANASSYSITVNGHAISGNLGGGMKNEFSSPEMTNVTISGNNSKTGGGGMHNINSSPEMANVTISGNTALGAGAGGGGISNESSSSPKLTDVTISGNNADYGGGIYSGTNSAPVMTNVTISGNNAANSSSGGGGMFNSSAAPVLANVTIFNNTASYGGGIYNSSSSAPVLDDVTISTNTASYGGGIYNYGSSPVLTNVTISGNKSNFNGGGMSNSSSSSPVLVNVKISGNDAGGGGGGGMYNSGTGSKPVLINALISGNKASDGGGIENSNSSPVLINVTIAGNSSYSGGGGMYNTGSSSLVYIYNSIVWGNTGGGSPGISENSSSSTNLANSIVQGVDSDPQFAAPLTSTPASGGDYSLSTSTSPAVNTGDGSRYPIDSNGNWDTSSSVYTLVTDPAVREKVRLALTEDLGGSPRFNSTIDMGAYEY